MVVLPIKYSSVLLRISAAYQTQLLFLLKEKGKTSITSKYISSEWISALSEEVAKLDGEIILPDMSKCSPAQVEWFFKIKRQSMSQYTFHAP